MAFWLSVSWVCKGYEVYLGDREANRSSKITLSVNIVNESDGLVIPSSENLLVYV